MYSTSQNKESPKNQKLWELEQITGPQWNGFDMTAYDSQSQWNEMII
jgi:hypothetical protein